MVALTPGCYGGLAEEDLADDGVGDGEDGGGDGEVSNPDSLCMEGPKPGVLPRAVRVTHSQYDAMVIDLLGLDTTPSDAFLADVAVGGFSNNAQALGVTDRLARDYRRSAELIAENLADNPDKLAALLSCDPSSIDTACAEEFIRSFGRRAYRRPLTNDELEAFGNVFFSADGLYETGAPFEQGVRLVIEAVLQSPHVLYRIELSSELSPDSEDLVPLTGYEIATRLSFLLWDSTPSDALLDAAEAGELDDAEGVQAWARAMLDDERATRPVLAFHEQWLELDGLDDIQKDQDLFPGFHSGMSVAFREETERFIERVALEMDGTYADLMTSNVSYANSDLAVVYGLSGDFTGELVEVELDSSERAGLLTQAGFLASHAFSNATSPIQRGVFVQRKLLCAAIPDPPGDVDTTLPPPDNSAVTTRERVTAHTSAPACSGCHDSINAPGFALEGYDAVGRVRSTDNGEPVDAASTVIIGSDMVDVDGAVELAHAIAQSEVGQRCYLVNWFRYANMRTENPDDQCTINGLHELMVEADYDIKELMVAMTQTATFRYRSPLEVQ